MVNYNNNNREVKKIDVDHVEKLLNNDKKIKYEDLDDGDKILYHIGRFRSTKNNDSFNYLLKYVEKDINICKTKWYIKGNEEEDLYQECCIQVIKAIENFDPFKGADFRSYCKLLFTGKLKSLLSDVERLKNVPLNFSYSLQSPVYIDSEGNSVNYEDIIHLEDRSFLNDLCDKEYFDSLELKLYTELSELETQSFFLYLKKYPYKEISCLLKKNRKSVGNAIQRVKTKIPQIFSEEIRIKELEFRNRKKKNRKNPGNKSSDSAE